MWFLSKCSNKQFKHQSFNKFIYKLSLETWASSEINLINLINELKKFANLYIYTR